MTQATSVQLDLGTINEVQQVVVRALRNQVCDWEQKAHDAGLAGDCVAAQQYKDWAFAAELCASTAFTACSTLFVETLDTLRVVEDTRTVQLPDLARSDKDRYLDALQVEVASHQQQV